MFGFPQKKIQICLVRMKMNIIGWPRDPRFHGERERERGETIINWFPFEHHVDGS